MTLNLQLLRALSFGILTAALVVIGAETRAQVQRELLPDDADTLEQEIDGASNPPAAPAAAPQQSPPQQTPPQRPPEQPPTGQQQMPQQGPAQPPQDSPGGTAGRGSEPTLADVILRLDALKASLPPPRVDTAYDMYKPMWVVIGVFVAAAAAFILAFVGSQNETARRVQEFALEHLEQATDSTPAVAASPSIHTVSPGRATGTGGAVVTISGYGFDRSTRVTLDGDPCRIVMFAPDRIEFEVPAVRFQDSRSVDLVVNTRGRETMRKFQVDSGVVLAARDVALDTLSGGWFEVPGEGFYGALTVDLGRDTLEHGVVSPRLLLVKFLPGAAGAKTVEITRENGISTRFQVTYPKKTTPAAKP